MCSKNTNTGFMSGRSYNKSLFYEMGSFWTQSFQEVQKINVVLKRAMLNTLQNPPLRIELF